MLHSLVKQRWYKVWGLLILLSAPFVIAGCAVANLQAGFEPASSEILAAADLVAGAQQVPRSISEYDRFEVSVSEGILVSVATREVPSAIANIFLVHGAGGGSWVWEYFFEEIPGHYNLYAVSWRGHFRSTPVKDARASDYVADQEAVVSAIGTRNSLPIHLVGHSYGGATSILQASRNPEAFASVSLLAPVVPLDYTLMQRIVVPSLAPFFIRRDARKGNNTEGAYGGMFLSKDRMQSYHEQHASRDYSREKPSLIAVDGIDPGWQNKLEDAYLAVAASNLRVQMIIARYDNVVVPARQRNMALRLGAKIIELHSGHYVPLDVASALAAREVSSFLKGTKRAGFSAGRRLCLNTRV